MKQIKAEIFYVFNVFVPLICFLFWRSKSSILISHSKLLVFSPLIGPSEIRSSRVFQLRYVSSVFAGGQRCASLSDRNVMGFIASLHELASAERRFYCKLCNIKTQLMRPLLELGRRDDVKSARVGAFDLTLTLCLFARRSSAESLSSAVGPVVLGLLQTMAGRFNLLCHLTGQHGASLTANLRRGRDIKSLLILDHTSIFLDAYREYV